MKKNAKNKRKNLTILRQKIQQKKLIKIYEKSFNFYHENYLKKCEILANKMQIIPKKF
jgi:hypothetical protein